MTVKTQNETLRYGDAYFVTTTNHPYFGGGFAILPKRTFTVTILIQ